VIPEPAQPGYDVEALRAHFPSLTSGIAHFDGPGGTQTPREVGAAVADTLTGPLSNRGHGSASEENAERAIAGFRSAFADFLGVPAAGVVYGRSATQLCYDFARALAKQWGPGDDVVVTRLDHDSNIRPWIQAADHVGATVRWIDLDPATSELDEASIDAALSPATRLVAVTGASNLLGTIPDVRLLADAAHALGALVHVDGVHYAAHHLPDLAELGADLFMCSPYKFLGPHCGVLGADPAFLETIHPDKLLPATDAVPERFELGTLPYEIMAGATAAVDFLAAIAPGAGATRRARLAGSFAAIDAHETGLRGVVEAGLAAFGPKMVLHSRAAERTPTLFCSLPGRTAWDAYEFLGGRDVLAPAGSFYAHEAFRRLGLPDQYGLRIGLAPYTTEAEVDRLLQGLSEFLG
jgi:cysteine desulfurase family protein (TIGR01976 family)